MHPPAVRERARELAAEGYKDAAVARLTGLPRTTVRDLRRSSPGALCPRCYQPTPAMRWTSADYALLLGAYLGDGCISAGRRTYRLRLSLDSGYPRVLDDLRGVLRRGFVGNRVGEIQADGGATTILSVYNKHLPCLLPQHGGGKKHLRRIALEPWQDEILCEAPFSFLQGCVWSDGCTFVNRTGPYEYLTVDFFNLSADIRELFARACDLAGIDYRMHAKRVRVNRRASVARLVGEIGTKR